MPKFFLDFEQPLADLLTKIQELRKSSANNPGAVTELAELESRLPALTQSVFSKLTPWQTNQMARHPERPYLLDYVQRFCTDFEELHGDRHFGDDRALIGGLARFDGQPVMIVGQQKGRDTKENLVRNWGMPRPEGYRKALRLFELAERFRLPLLTFIDTPGAFPGIDAEERNQSEAIARNLLVLSQLKTPIICTIIGEGGSGGALAIGVGDATLMLEFSTYSVISPEGCSSILWKTRDQAPLAAQALGITAPRLQALGLIDTLVAEPLGGAHRDYDTAARLLGDALRTTLAALTAYTPEALQQRRYQRLMAYGQFSTAVPELATD